MTDLVRALRDDEPATLGGLLAGDVVFNSPVRTYRDRDDVIHLITLIGRLFEDVRVVREWSGPRGAATFVSAHADGAELGGVLEEIHDPEGRVVELTLMLRPFTEARRAIEAMGRVLAKAPLPSGASV